MKPRFIYALAVIVAAIGMTSCEGGGGSGKLKELEFKRMHLDGVNALALASISSDAQNAPRRAPTAEGDTVYDMRDPIYSVSEDGTLVEVSYTINCRGNGEIIDMVQAHMRLAMEYIYPIGDDWLWLYNCRYDYPELDQVEEPYRSMLAEKCNPLMSKHFLVRLKDGALFEWDYRAMPYLAEDRQGHSLTGRRQPSDIYGVVETVGGDLYSNEISTSVMLYQLKDQGDYLDVRTMHESGQTMWFNEILPDKRGYVGGSLGFAGGDYGYQFIPGVLFPNSTDLDIARLVGDESLENAEWELISVDDILYAVAIVRNYGTIFYSVELKDSPIASAKAGEKIAEVLGVEMSVSHMYDQTKLVSKSGTYSWMQDDMKYTFDPQAKKVNSMNLPEHYPNTINDYFDDVAYVMNSDEKSFYICDLAKSAAELVAIDLSEYNEYKPQIATEKPFEEYDPSIRAFKKTATTMNGKQLTIIVDVAGESKGKARVIKPGDSTAGTVISVMVRLN
ncbi:MAG: hypothetical protein II825_05355 [Paludibacteraceae bacterium]|nr:hypothetical protein [Paludibacteraceae bacterium]